MKILRQKTAGRLLALRSVGSAALEQGQGQGQEKLASEPGPRLFWSTPDMG